MIIKAQVSPPFLQLADTGRKMEFPELQDGT